MTEQFEMILRRYGKAVKINGAAAVKAFVQQIRRKDEHPPEDVTDFGAADLRRWLYIGPKQQSLQAGDSVRADGVEFRVQNAAAVYIGGEKGYWWAILCPMRERMT